MATEKKIEKREGKTKAKSSGSGFSVKKVDIDFLDSYSFVNASLGEMT